MSGHSKWAQIKRKKAVNDAKRGKIFSKLIKEITVAARIGGEDDSTNPRLRQAILSAKAQNMPAANIERAIAKGVGGAEGTNYEEVSYEAYGLEGVAILIEALTDNKNRTVSDIRHIISKYGGTLATAGSVSWIFEKKGAIIVEGNSCSEDDLLLIAVEAGAEDLNVAGNYYEITTLPSSFEKVKSALETNGIKILEATASMIPKNTVKVSEQNSPKILSLMEELEEHDDVQNVYSNFDIDDAVLENLQGDK